MTAIIAGITAALISSVLFVRLKDIGDKPEERHQKIKWFILAAAVYTVIDCTIIKYMYSGGSRLSVTCSTVILANAMFLLAVIDLRYKKIPNRCILGLVLIRTFCILWQGIQTESVVSVFINSFAGLVTGLAVLAAISLISKQGIGAGDIKMYAAIGYFIGCSGVLDILMYSSFFCTVAGIFLVIIKKCRMKSLVPMAPFAFMGTMLYFILYMNEGLV